MRKKYLIVKYINSEYNLSKNCDIIILANSGGRKNRDSDHKHWP